MNSVFWSEWTHSPFYNMSKYDVLSKQELEGDNNKRSLTFYFGREHICKKVVICSDVFNFFFTKMNLVYNFCLFNRNHNIAI